MAPGSPTKVKCKICDADVARSSLRRHMKKKHEDRGARVLCSEGCGLDFIDQNGMAIHLRTMHNKQTFPCTGAGCEDAPPFHAQQQLINHVNIVHLEKFKCPYPDCSRHSGSMASMKNLANHIDANHGGIAYVELDSGLLEDTEEDEAFNKGWIRLDLKLYTVFSRLDL